MEDRAELYKALCAFQLQAVAVPKGNTAQVPTKSGGSFSYSYADLAGVIQHTKAALAANGLCYFQTFGHEERDVVLITTVAHVSGASIQSSIPMRGDNMNDPQKMGGLISYYRRYALLAILGLATEDDDANQARQQPKRQSAAPARSQPQPAAQPAPSGDQAAMDLGAQIITEFHASIEKARSIFQLEDIGKQLKASGITDDGLRAAYKTKQIALAATS